MDPEVLRDRTKSQCLQVIGLLKHLPSTMEAQVIGRQLMRSSSSVASNYRAACLARSRAEFVAKLCIVLEEADESVFWLELLQDAAIIDSELLKDVLKEARELLLIFSASRKTARSI